VREESHLDEMRSAIRGDFERLRERRGDQELMRVADPESEAEVDEAREPSLRHEVPAEPEPEPGEAEQHRSWLARFLSP
jgi:hypothetical protein